MSQHDVSHVNAFVTVQYTVISLVHPICFTQLEDPSDPSWQGNP